MAGTKRKIAIMKRETKSQRSVAFSKRRRGLFKKAADLCLLSGASVAVLATPPSDKADIYSFGHSSVEIVVDAFLSGRRPPETHDCFLGLGFLSESHNTDDPVELKRLIDKTQELRNNVAALLETRGKASKDSDLPIRESEDFGFPELDACCGDIGNAASDYGFSVDDYEISEFSFAGTEEEGTSRTLGTHVSGDSVNEKSGCVGVSDRGVNLGAFETVGFGNSVFGDGFSNDCSESAKFSYAGTLADENSYGGSFVNGYSGSCVPESAEYSYAEQNSYGGSFDPLGDVYYSFVSGNSVSQSVEFSYAGTEAEEISYSGSFDPFGNI